MERERLERMCPIQRPDSSLANRVWTECARISPSASALVFGTVDGVVANGTKRVTSKSRDLILEGAGAAGVGLALKAASKKLALPVALLAGAGTVKFAGDVCDAGLKSSTILADASKDPVTARREVAQVVGPVAFECLALTVFGLLAGKSLNVSENVSEKLTSLRPHSTYRIGPETTLSSFRSYKLPHVDFGYFSPTSSSKSQLILHKISSAKRDCFNGNMELKFNPYLALVDDSSKHALVKSFERVRSLNPPPDGYVRIPTLSRAFSTVSCGMKPLDHPEAKIYNGARESIVKITGFAHDGSSACGSGFIISEDGKVATALHVVADAQRFKIKTNGGTEYDAHLVAHDFDTDLAVLKIAAQRQFPTRFWVQNPFRFVEPPVAFKPLSLSTAPTQSSHEVYLLGHPAGSNSMFLSPGLFHRKGYERAYLSPLNTNELLYQGRVFETRSYFVHDRTGNSGGPVLNKEGKVIAVHTDGDTHARNSYDEVRVGVGTSVNELQRLVNSMPPAAQPINWKPYLLFQKNARACAQPDR